MHVREFATILSTRVRNCTVAHFSDILLPVFIWLGCACTVAVASLPSTTCYSCTICKATERIPNVWQDRNTRNPWHAIVLQAYLGFPINTTAHTDFSPNADVLHFQHLLKPDLPCTSAVGVILWMGPGVLFEATNEKTKEQPD